MGTLQLVQGRDRYGVLLRAAGIAARLWFLPSQAGAVVVGLEMPRSRTRAGKYSRSAKR